ncbi:hypothetical protein [Nocardioides hwasunensis]|uniref:WD40 repeat domain-containing protein n=1 Tax=Nocardioides hwasunensis TaxID=397258 RepID=A0ABR8ME86_9ACTN|nr:hypothetical protein [Nocardioides hwasunensis]MBD3913531.1 hypothetical protein [Nocardioides hwasunensis]
MQKLRRLPLAVAAALLVSATLAVSSSAAAPESWGALQEADGHGLAVALDGEQTALISVGGSDEATVYDQRRAGDGSVGAPVEVMTVAGADHCRPVEAASADGNLAVAVECQRTTDLEDPPTRLVELVWTGDDGWAWRVQPEGELGSLDWSPGGQFALFTSNSQYGRPHHLTSYHPDLGWRDLTRRERGLTGDTMIAAVDDSGDAVALRGAGFEDKPGYWFGGRLRIETYDAARRTWTTRVTRRYPDGGVHPTGLDLDGGRIAATVVESRSTGRLDSRDSRVVVLSGRPGDPRVWAPRRWSRQVVTSSAAITGQEVAVVAWQAVDRGRTARPRVATWVPRRPQPRVRSLAGATTLTDATVSGDTMDLAVSAGGRGVVAWVAHTRGARQSSVEVTSFQVGRDGHLRHPVAATWSQPVGATVAVTSGDTSSAVTIGRVIAQFYPAPETRFAVIG